MAEAGVHLACGVGRGAGGGQPGHHTQFGYQGFRFVNLQIWKALSAKPLLP